MSNEYYGKNGVMTEGWDTEREAQFVYDLWYILNEECAVYLNGYVTEYNGKWVIMYRPLEPPVGSSL